MRCISPGARRPAGKARGARILGMLAIHLTKVTPTYSGGPRGGLSADAGRIRGAVCDRGRVPALSRRRCAGPTGSAVRAVAERRRGRSATVRVRRLWSPDVGHGRDDLSGHPDAVDHVVPRDVVGDQTKTGTSALGLQRVLGLGSYQTAWAWLHKLRRAMVRPGRDRLSGLRRSRRKPRRRRRRRHGRSTAKKALIVVAAEEVGRGIGRIRMRRIPDGSSDSLLAFVQEAIAPGAEIHTDGWHGYDHLKRHGYRHRVTYLRGHHELASELLPRVHRVVSLLKRWLLGTHQGAVTPRASGLLPGRVHLPLQPSALPPPREAVLPLGATSRRRRARALPAPRQTRAPRPPAATTTGWGHLSQVDSQHWAYLSEEQRRQAGCPARELCESSRFQGTSRPL